MNGKRLLLFVLSLLYLASMAVSVLAQEPLNVSCIRQFEYNWHSDVYDVGVQGDYAYVACNYEGMRIIDISQPQNYIERAQLNIYRATAIAVSGEFAYVGNVDAGVAIVDISSKSNPEIALEFPLPGYTYAIRVYGNYVYVCSSDGLTVLDITNPTEPTLAMNIPEFIVHDVSVRDSLAYLTCAYGGLRKYDISDFSAPVLIDTYNANSGSEIFSVNLYGNYGVLASGWEGFQIVDLTTMELVSEIDSLYFALWVKVQGDYAYLAYGYPECPLAIINISNPTVPQLTSIYYPPEDIAAFTLVDENVYIADYRHGIRTVDVSDPANPVERVSYNRYGYDSQIIINGNIAYALSTFKLTAIDISNPNTPQELGYFEGNWEFSDVKIDGNIAYVLIGEPSTLYSVDFTNPSEPVLLQAINTQDYYNYYRFEIYDHYLYWLGWEQIEIYDISDPAQMVLVGTYNMSTDGWRIDIFEHYAVVISRANNIVLLDLQNPIEPLQVASHHLSENCHDIETCGNTLYALTDNSLKIFDISDLSNWRLLCSRNLVNDGLSNAISGKIDDNLLYLALGGDGIAIYDVSAPSSPQLAGYFNTPGNARNIALNSQIAVVADYTNLGLYDCSGVTGTFDHAERILPGEIALMPNYPNPFNSSTLIRFEVGIKSNVAIDVIDLLGRQVAVLTDAIYEPGRHSIRWDGSAIDGRTVSSGQYFIRAESGAVTKCLPVTLLK